MDFLLSGLAIASLERLLLFLAFEPEAGAVDVVLLAEICHRSLHVA
jgi:hypothetical protein